ncbi:uncharacterized protein LOC106013103 [Aplysia californica]|uniref:Uncharacterized protein LOC106013103 n=1 Tax=Aplysia californica TaxID=6500 RepID=A0ABM1A9G0_APLCA|nr:uncharacterized protein LOC106013103 [Aplysia californica]
MMCPSCSSDLPLFLCLLVLLRAAVFRMIILPEVYVHKSISLYITPELFRMSLLIRLNTLLTYLCLFLYVYHIPFLSSQMTNNHGFRRFQSPKLGIIQAGTYARSSLLACCSSCLSRHWSAYFIFNKKAGTCTCAASLNNEGTPPTGLDNFYAHTKNSQCDVSSGFNVFLYKNVAVCLLVVTDKKLYSDAELSCMNFINGRLFATDSKDKLQLLKRVSSIPDNHAPRGFWVGLDDRLVENQFVWAHGRNATQTEIGTLFEEGEPNNKLNEDCVLFNTDHFSLLDIPCFLSRSYVCETPLHV